MANPANRNGQWSNLDSLLTHYLSNTGALQGPEAEGGGHRLGMVLCDYRILLWIVRQKFGSATILFDYLLHIISYSWLNLLTKRVWHAPWPPLWGVVWYALLLGPHCLPPSPIDLFFLFCLEICFVVFLLMRGECVPGTLLGCGKNETAIALTPRSSPCGLRMVCSFPYCFVSFFYRHLCFSSSWMKEALLFPRPVCTAENRWARAFRGRRLHKAVRSFGICVISIIVYFNYL